MDTKDRHQFKPLPVPVHLLKAARELRQQMTDAEQLLWFFLRRRQVGGFRFRRQHPVQGFVLDFYCPEAKVAVEVDGGQHGEASLVGGDAQRTRSLERLGIVVVRYWNNEVVENMEGVLQSLYQVLIERAGGRLPPP